MPYAECIGCAKIVTRPGARGTRIGELCCPFCGGLLINASTPAELVRLKYNPYDPDLRGIYDRAPQAVAKWLYDARRHEEDWLRFVRGTQTLTKRNPHPAKAGCPLRRVLWISRLNEDGDEVYGVLIGNGWRLGLWEDGGLGQAGWYFTNKRPPIDWHGRLHPFCTGWLWRKFERKSREV